MAYKALLFVYDRKPEFRESTIYGKKAYELFVQLQEPIESQFKQGNTFLVRTYFELGELGKFGKALVILKELSSLGKLVSTPERSKSGYYYSPKPL